MATASPSLPAQLRGASPALRRTSSAKPARRSSAARASAERAAGAAFAPPVSQGNELLVPEGKYCEKHYQSIRRPTRCEGRGAWSAAIRRAHAAFPRTVMIGNVPVGSAHPIARQTMTTTDTRDVEATVAQASPRDNP